MSMPPEPLTPEERALAQSLSRVGPQGGPSADLDARILGAARAAVQPARTRGDRVPTARRRWPLGIGVAASVLLAAGIAWQLRPTHEVPVASEMPSTPDYPSGGASADQEVAAADAGANPAADAAAAEPARVAEGLLPPPPAKVLTPPAGRPASGPARQNAEAAARQEAAPKRTPRALLPTPMPPSPPAPAAPPQAFPAETADAYARTSAADSNEAIAETVAREQVREQRIAVKQQQELRARDNEERREATTKVDDGATLDTISVTGSRVKRRENQTKTRDMGTVQAPVAAAPPPPPPPAASAGSVQPSAARNALRRTDLQVPVDADTRLPPEEWLDRIRLRRDLGDDANALRSLQLFVQEHPFQRVPDDLRPLLGNP